MENYTYPAIFYLEENNIYDVCFPDFDDIHTCGDDLNDAILMAEDLLSMVICDYIENGKMLPAKSDISDIKINENGFVNYILVDVEKYKKRRGKKAIKKTLTIPQWLNEEAMSFNLNFSQILQEALITKIDLLKQS